MTTQNQELLKALNLLVLEIEEHYTRGKVFNPPSQIELAYYNAKNAINNVQQ